MARASFARFDNLPVFKQAIDRLLYVAKVLVGAETAAVLMSQGGVKHCIAESGLASGIVTVPWQWKDLPFKPNQTYVQQAPTNLNISRLLAATTGHSSVGLFIRLPLIVSESYDLALQLYARESSKTPSASDLRLLKYVANAISLEIKATADKLATQDSLVSIAATQAEVVAEVKASDRLRILLDSEFRIVAASSRVAALLGTAQEQLAGEAYFKVIRSSAEPLTHLFRQVLDTSLSSPLVQIIVDDLKARRSFSLRASPFRASDQETDMLDVQYWDESETRDIRRRRELQGEGFQEDDIQEEHDPAGQFLLDTLLFKRSLRLRDDTTYLTIRAWRNSIPAAPGSRQCGRSRNHRCLTLSGWLEESAQSKFTGSSAARALSMSFQYRAGILPRKNVCPQPSPKLLAWKWVSRSFKFFLTCSSRDRPIPRKTSNGRKSLKCNPCQAPQS